MTNWQRELLYSHWALYLYKLTLLYAVENLGRQSLYKGRWEQAYLRVLEGPPDERKSSVHNIMTLHVQRGKKSYESLVGEECLLMYLEKVNWHSKKKNLEGTQSQKTSLPENRILPPTPFFWFRCYLSQSQTDTPLTRVERYSSRQLLVQWGWESCVCNDNRVHSPSPYFIFFLGVSLFW